MRLKKMNKLRRLAISIIEETEEHINQCNKEEKKPFDKEEWYMLEDKIYDELKNYLVGVEE